jgi:hypothetical protein
MPENASLNAAGFRMYAWPGGTSELHEKYNATEPANVISVTAARSVIGTPTSSRRGRSTTWSTSRPASAAEWRDYSKSTRGRS